MDAYDKAQNISILTPTIPKNRLNLFTIHLYRDFLKRIFDLFLCAISLPFIIPILLILFLLIKLDSKGSPIFKSERIGKDGKRFGIYKLRSMSVNADLELKELLARNEKLKLEWERDHKLKNDPRITPTGRIIRALSLDELPQVFNVLKGEMSFVGPRPIVDAEITKYGSDFNIYKSVRPGITGIWQVNGRNDISYNNRISMDVEYVKTSKLTLDIKILAKTIPSTLSRKGAY